MEKINKYLSKESKKILKDLPKESNHNLRVKIDNNLFIKDLYNKIKRKYTDYKKNNIKYTIIREDFILEQYDFIKNSQYLDKSIYENIKINIKSNYKVNKDKITLNIFTNDIKLTKTVKEDINNYLTIISIMGDLFCINKKNINILFFQLNMNKKLPTNNKEFIGPYHVNSGLTYYNKYNATIIIFRNEEKIKVLIHELIHAYDIDNILHNNKILTNEIYNKYCLNIFEYNNININETYTEFLALIINILFIIVISGSSLKIINNLIKFEIIYSLIKVKCIVDFYNFDINNICRNEGCVEFRQKSNVLSYYIFKTALLYNINTALNYFYVCTKDLKIINSYCVNNFIKLINSSMNTLYFKIISGLTFNKKLNNTLRMTLFELK